jgi:hypothetical protein
VDARDAHANRRSSASDSALAWETMATTTTTTTGAARRALVELRVFVASYGSVASDSSTAAATTTTTTQRNDGLGTTSLGRTSKRRDALYDYAPGAPPETWGESASRLARVVRLSWSEALARLGIWRLDHVLAIRMLSRRDMRMEIARDAERYGTRVNLEGGGKAEENWGKNLKELKMAIRYSKSLRRAPDLKTVAAQGGVELDTILLSDLQPQLMRPAYVLFRDDFTRRLVFVVRGTHSAKDMITNLTGSVCPHHTMGDDGKLKVGYAHSGFLTTARFLERKIKGELAAALDAHPGYELKIVGHSLGAGVAVLLTEMLRQDDKFQSVGLHCYTFACPSTLSRELAESCRTYVTTCVNNADLVPFVSFSKVTELQSEVVRTALEQRLLEKWKESKSAMACALGPTPSKFAAAAAAVGRQNYGPHKYPNWLRALKSLKKRHDNLVETSSLYRQSLLIGKSVSKTSSKLASLSGAFIAGIVAPKPRQEVRKSDSKDKTEFSKTNQQVGDTISGAVLATDISHTARAAASRDEPRRQSKEEDLFEEYIRSARIALDEDFQRPLTKADRAKIYKVEASAAQEVLALDQDISVMRAAERLVSDEEATHMADYYGADLPPLRMDDIECPPSEYEPVIKRPKQSSEDERRDEEQRGTVLLFPAGRILHFIHENSFENTHKTTSSDASKTQHSMGMHAPKKSKHALIADVNLDMYSRIILSRTMIADHFLAQYESVVNGFIEEFKSGAE